MNWGLLVLDIVWPPGWALVWWLTLRLLHWPLARLDRIAYPWLSAAAWDMVIDAATAAWLCAAVSAAQVGIALAIWWWRRRKDRKRALAALGAKSLARLAAIVRRAREAAKPRPVLQPQRGGVS